MRLIVHDFAGHPFQVQLSRALAMRGHEVLHLYAANLQTPRGGLTRRPADPLSFGVAGLDLGEPFEKYGLFRRRRQESRYGELLAARIAAFRPEAVLSANTPLGAQAIALRAAHDAGARFVFWVQDVLSIGIGAAVREKLPLGGEAVGWYYARVEGRLLRASDAAVVISADFRPALRAWGVPDDRVHVIENWAPLDELPPAPRENPWAKAHALDARFCFLYSGTLGLKHQPQLLVRLAEAFRDDPEVRVVVVSEGIGADWIARRARELALENVLVLPFQPYESLPQVLAAADVLVTILHDEAATFSVPSKVLSYLCTRRPILAAIPAANLAARLVAEAGAGIVVSPVDEPAFLAGARELRASADRRAALAGNGRRYAESAFDIDAIAHRFERVLGRT